MPEFPGAPKDIILLWVAVLDARLFQQTAMHRLLTLDNHRPYSGSDIPGTVVVSGVHGGLKPAPQVLSTRPVLAGVDKKPLADDPRGLPWAANRLPWA